MFYVVLYFALASLGAGIVFALLRNRVRRPKALACIALALPWLPYLTVAVQTALFGDSLRPAVRRAFVECGGMCGDTGDKVLTYQVLRVTPWAAEVYLVTPCAGGMLKPSESGRNAVKINLKHTPDGWHYADYDDTWSECGSAKGNVFPPDPTGKSF